MLLLNRFICVWLCATPETAAHQAPLSLGFSRQEHCSGLPLPSPMPESEKWKWSCSVVSDSSRPHGLQPTRLLRPWDFPGESTEVGCHRLLRFTSCFETKQKLFTIKWNWGQLSWEACSHIITAKFKAWLQTPKSWYFLEKHITLTIRVSSTASLSFALRFGLLVALAHNL